MNQIFSKQNFETSRKLVMGKRMGGRWNQFSFSTQYALAKDVLNFNWGLNSINSGTNLNLLRKGEIQLVNWFLLWAVLDSIFCVLKIFFMDKQNDSVSSVGFFLITFSSVQRLSIVQHRDSFITSIISLKTPLHHHSSLLFLELYRHLLLCALSRLLVLMDTC